jgi:hypothetical protein
MLYRSYHATLRIGLLVISLLFFKPGGAQITVSLSNCSATVDEVQMDISVSNTGSTELRWCAAVLRINIPAAILPAGSNTYTYNYVGGSDFPLSFDVENAKAKGAVFNAATGLLTLCSTDPLKYGNASCTAPLIAPGVTKKIGRFSFKINNAHFIAGAAELNFHTSSGCVLYDACSRWLVSYNNISKRTLSNSCSFKIPAK